MPIDPKSLGNDRYTVADATDSTPPIPGMDPGLWQSIRHMIGSAVLANMAQVLTLLREREAEADALAEKHAGHDCPMLPLAMGLAMGVGASCAMMAEMMDTVRGMLPADMARTAEQAGAKAAQAIPGFLADTARLEATLRGALNEAAKDEAAPRPPIRPRSPRDGGAIH